MKNDFGVGMGRKNMSAREQLFPQFYVIEDLTVEGDPDRSVFIVNRLVAAAQVNDAQPGIGQSDAVV